MIERLTWDTDHFGVGIGRVIGSTVSADDVAEADQLDLRCLYLLVEAADISAVAAAQDLGFRVIDERLTLGRPLVGREPVGSDDTGLQPRDRRSLRTWSRSSRWPVLRMPTRGSSPTGTSTARRPRCCT